MIISSQNTTAEWSITISVTNSSVPLAKVWRLIELPESRVDVVDVSRMGVIKMRNSPWALSRCELMFALIITTVSAGRQASNYKDRKGVLTVAPCPLVSVVAPVLILGSNSPRSDRSTCTSGGNDCRRQPGCLLRPHCCIQRCHCHALCHWSH